MIGPATRTGNSSSTLATRCDWLRSSFVCWMTVIALWLLLFGEEVDAKRHVIEDPDFIYGTEKPSVAIYRLIGNDMPPLQSVGQLRWNTQYALDNEKHFDGASKRWILNRIWNETEFELIYGSLIKAGVHRRDIIARCFDIDEYMQQPTLEDKLLYLTSQNAARNEGITDGRDSGAEWSVILDGNTFITKDSWASMQNALVKASEEKKKYLKIPYHRVQSEPSPLWLNSTTTIPTVLKFAPTKGESQLAFHKTATEFFTLGDTKPENKAKGKPTKGYGQRNKSYMFKDGQICSQDSSICACAKYPDANEEDASRDISIGTKLEYSSQCGVVLRLWSYPTADVISTGLSESEEAGFFCYLKSVDSSIKHTTECDLMNKALIQWRDLPTAQKEPHRAKSKSCKDAYRQTFVTDSCIRGLARANAQNWTNLALEKIAKQPKSSSVPLCKRLKLTPTDPARKTFLIAYNETTLALEKEIWEKRHSAEYVDMEPLVIRLIQAANRGLTLGPYSVVDKKRTPKATNDKRFYHSARPYFWPLDECPDDIKEQVKSGKLARDPLGFVRRDGIRHPGTIIGHPLADEYDRASAWFLVDNVTTLALAWHFTGDKKYSDYGATLVRTFFLDPVKGMYPSLEYAQDGEPIGLIDWKDFYYLTDAFTLLERSGSLQHSHVTALQSWCAKLARWLLNSNQGHEEAISPNNHGLYIDLTMLSLSIYAQQDDLVDIVRSRLLYRLSRPHPLGHFALDGSPPNELKRTISLHYITFNLAGWVHATIANEAVRRNSELENVMESLLWVRHEGDPDGDPVLLKAIRWFAKWLPPTQAYYEKFTEPEKGMHVNYPYQQDDAFAFDRMVEIIQFGVGAYGVKKLFGVRPSQAVNLVLARSKYTTKYASLSEYSSVLPDSGAKAWAGFGIYDRYGLPTLTLLSAPVERPKSFYTTLTSFISPKHTTSDTKSEMKKAGASPRDEKGSTTVASSSASGSTASKGSSSFVDKKKIENIPAFLRDPALNLPATKGTTASSTNKEAQEEQPVGEEGLEVKIKFNFSLNPTIIIASVGGALACCICMVLCIRCLRREKQNRDITNMSLRTRASMGLP
jgi:anti-sigma28 factor (negative regulator of flagellin synthesis)